MKKMIVGGRAAFAAALGIAAAGCGRCCPAKCPTSRCIPAVSDELIGCVGSVTTATRGAAVLGEVMLAVAGHQQAYLGLVSRAAGPGRAGGRHRNARAAHGGGGAVE